MVYVLISKTFKYQKALRNIHMNCIESFQFLIFYTKEVEFMNVIVGGSLTTLKVI